MAGSGNRRVQRMELADSGAAMFNRLRTVATRHDELLQLRLSTEEAALIEDLLAKPLTAVADAR